ncbi:MAG: hypothetical protein IPN58_10375 [Anaerolineales bacterium]|nr:hypothetical protein [Anaerolineales bacterium]
MSFPNFPDKEQSEPIMKPEDTIEMRRKFGRFPAIDPPKWIGLMFEK